MTAVNRRCSAFDIETKIVLSFSRAGVFQVMFVVHVFEKQAQKPTNASHSHQAMSDPKHPLTRFDWCDVMWSDHADERENGQRAMDRKHIRISPLSRAFGSTQPSKHSSETWPNSRNHSDHQVDHAQEIDPKHASLLPCSPASDNVLPGRRTAPL